MPGKSKAVVSFGSNIEPRLEYLGKALKAVSRFPGTRLMAFSEAEETVPLDVPPQFSEMKFLNRLAIFETELSPYGFSSLMHKVEDELGRVRTVKNGPRTIDIDLIDFDGIVLDDPMLTLPHPRAKDRDFVMRPWKELLNRIR